LANLLGFQSKGEPGTWQHLEEMHAGAEIAAQGLVQEVSYAWGNLELKLPDGHLSDGIVVVPDLQALLGLNDGAP
jgi:hypothetical protein